ncbi:MAG: alanine racemase, partial [Bacteroidia bacterium]|nr:alanine racemase [Bacteroidia bacterium]
DLKALEHNFDYLKSKINPNVKMLGVVKAFAYGSDAIEIAKFLQDLGIDYLAVAYTKEGVVLRESGVKVPILVLHPQLMNFKAIIDNCLEPSIYSSRVLNEFIGQADHLSQKEYPIHIKFNTGLNRLGFWENDVDHVISQLKATSSVKVKSIFSHLAASEDLLEKDFTLRQISDFTKSSEELINKLGYSSMRHMTNTSGILNYPEAHFDMVRTGIGLYGFGNSKSENKKLKPVASLKSVISQIHMIEKGESVGYNRSYQASGFEKTATIPIGHADGISRQFGNGKGFVFINGRKASIIGNVCMDMLMVNISNIDCKEGDEVIVFDRSNTAENLAESVGTISYELITAVSQRVKRVFCR